jgi:hypothetical protein
LAKSPKTLDPLHSTYSKCIDIAVQGGKISKQLGQEILKAENPEDAIANAVKNLSRLKREQAIQSIRIAQGFESIKNHGSNNAMTGLMNLMVKDITGKGNLLNVEQLGKVFSMRYMAKWADSLSMFRTRMFGLSQDTEGLNKFIRAVYGEDVGDAKIMKAAQDWLKLVDEMRTDFNKAGGSIPKNEDFLLPQMHDMRRVKAAEFTEWRAFIINKLDRNKIVDDQGRQLSDNNFEDALKYIYESITTGGLNKAKDFTVGRLGTKLSRKGSERRFLYFKDAESWIAYQNKFGKGDILTTITDNIQSMAQDTALMNIFGTNPKQTFEILKAEAEKLQIERGKSPKERTKGTLNAVYKTVSGDINGGELTTLADGFQFVRNIQVASKLGGAILSSVTDIASTLVTSAYNKIPFVKVYSRQLSQMNPTNEQDRIFAARMGLVIENWYGRAHSQNRFADSYGTGASVKLAEAVLRFSGLEAWTSAGRKAFGMEFSGMLSDNFGKTFNQLDPTVQKVFKNYQITELDWNNFRATKPLNLKGSKFADLTKDESMKFHSMILSETDYAVPTPDARVRAIATGGLERGSFWGQMSRSAMMIKSFPMTIAQTHLYRGFTQSTTGGKMMYLGGFTLSATLMGGFALQLKDIAAGREPRKMDNLEFWKDAFIQGGSGSLFADYVISDVEKYGNSYADSLGGPMVGFANQLGGLTLGNIQDVLEDRDTNIVGESIKFTKDIIPDPWQIQLFKNSMMDNVRLWADPSYQSSLNRIRSKQYRDYGQEYWWAPAETPMEVLEDL